MKFICDVNCGFLNYSNMQKASDPKQDVVGGSWMMERCCLPKDRYFLKTIPNINNLSNDTSSFHSYPSHWFQQYVLEKLLCY